MKKVTIKYFKEKHQDRTTFICTLISYQSDLGLKGAKDKLDNILDGIPIIFEILDDRLSEFLAELDTLKLEYEVI